MAFFNPLEEVASSKTAEPCVLVIFGVTGDLTARKLAPALYNLTREGQLPSHFACVGFARRPKTTEQFRQEMYDAIAANSRVKPIDNHIWDSFGEQLFYHQSEFDNDEGYERLKLFLEDIDTRFGTKGNRVFYLSVPPSYFPQIVEKLGAHKLLVNPDETKDRWTRVIVEKPFGHDFATAIQLQNDLTHYLKEEQIFRIDHYLGKETVQNLLVMRFANSIFESVWNNHYIDHVQISWAEDLGIGTRGKLWEESGMMRDIVQNHLMQLISLVAMEPPVNLKADSIRDEKVKVLESIRPIKPEEIEKHVIAGQYGAGFINGTPVKGYRQEENVNPNSIVETFVTMRLFIDNWRWSGVPFYLRAGKRLPKRATEIAITFKEAPNILFKRASQKDDANVLVIRIQPNEGISLRMNSKVPGINNLIQPVKMDFQYSSYFGASPPEAYERLLIECIFGDSTLFAREDEVLASWKLISPIFERWQKTPPANFPNYAAGSWGPDAADKLLLQDGRSWRLL